jgi:hypothetical protein
MRTASVLCVAAMASVCLASPRADVRKGPSLEQSKKIEEFNSVRREIDERLRRNSVTVTRPYAEHEPAGFLLFDQSFSYSSDSAKIGMAKNLPADMKLVVLAPSANSAASTKAFFSRYISAKRLEVINVGKSAGFWSRDSLPIPVYANEDGESKLALVDAHYYHGNEADAEIAARFQTPLIKFPYYFEGGNFAANTRGECISIQKNVPEDEFKSTYGCKTWLRLSHLAGIGHIDEHVKFIDDDRVLTDMEEYVAPLEAAGYQVVRLPRPEQPIETYVNSLLANGTIFMPAYSEPTDAEAEAVYKTLGFKVVSLPSVELSNSGQGSVHCITMTYPNAVKAQLLEWLTAD